MMIRWVAPVNPSHPYLENDPAPSFDPHQLRISPWLWFRNTQLLVDAVDRFWSRFRNPAPPAPPLTGIRFHGNAVPSVGGTGDEPEMTGLVRTTVF